MPIYSQNYENQLYSTVVFTEVRELNKMNGTEEGACQKRKVTGWHLQPRLIDLSEDL